MLPSSWAGAIQDQPHDTIRQAAASFVQRQHAATPGRIQVEVGKIDPRLKLPMCDRPLTAFVPAGGTLTGNTSVGVQCEGAQSWKIYVQTTVRLFRPVLVAKRYLPRGTRLTASDVEPSERDVSGLALGYLTDPASLRDKILKYPVQAGMALSPRSLRAPTLVRRGEEVTILARAGGLEVRMRGVAMMDGARGERIKVKAKQSQRVIEGDISDRGIVQVTL